MSKTNHISSRRLGFTLVELLVVIGIIAVLIGILLPALSKARAQANTVKCMSNMRQLHAYTMIYATEYNNYALPANMYWNNGTVRWEYGDWSGTIARLYFKAPLSGTNGAPLYGAAAFEAIEKTGMSKFLQCPAIDMPEYDPSVGINSTTSTKTAMKWSYLYNGGLGRYEQIPGYTGTDPASNNAEWAPKKRNQVPPCVLTLVDRAGYLPSGFTNNYRFFHYSREVNPLDSSWATVGGYAAQPHGTKALPKSNVLLFDGSVMTISLKQYNKTPNNWTIDSRQWAYNPEYAGRRQNVTRQTTLSLD